MATMPLPEARELLVQTRRRLEDFDNDYYYPEWRDCLCGNLYQVSMGKRAYANRSVTNPGRNRYGRLMDVLDPLRLPGALYVMRESAMPIRISSWLRGGGRKAAIKRLDALIESFDTFYGPVGMDIGKEQPARTVTPREIPVPTEVPEREQIPSREPSRTPERTPEQVPTR